MLDKGYLLRVVIKGTTAKQYQGVIGFNTAKFYDVSVLTEVPAQLH